MNTRIAFLSLIALLIAGCGGKKSEFLAALNKDPGTNICVADGRLGVTEWQHSGMYYLADKGSNPFAADTQVKALGKLRRLGFVSSTATRFKGETPWQTVTGYQLTDKGKKLFIWKKGACIGTRRATEVVEYTQPAAVNGVMVTRVHFKYEVDMNDSVQELGVGAALRKGSQGENLDGDGQAIFSKTNKGWHLEAVQW